MNGIDELQSVVECAICIGDIWKWEWNVLCWGESGVVVEFALKISEMEMWVWMVLCWQCMWRCDRDEIGYHSCEGWIQWEGRGSKLIERMVITFQSLEIHNRYHFTYSTTLSLSRFHFTPASFRDITSRFGMSFVRSLHQISFYVSWESLGIVHRNDMCCKRDWKGMVMVVWVFKQWDWNA